MQSFAILLAKSADIVRASIEDALKAAGYEVHTAVDNDSALLQLKKHHIDLVLADMQLPGPGCLALLNEARALDPTIGFICLNGYSEPSAMQDAVRHQVDDFLLVPYDKREIFFRIEICLEKRTLRKSARSDSLLAICSCCKKARDEKSRRGRGKPAWIALDAYLARRTDFTMTHCLCPDCAKQYHAELDRVQNGDNDRRIRLSLAE